MWSRMVEILETTVRSEGEEVRMEKAEDRQILFASPVRIS